MEVYLLKSFLSLRPSPQLRIKAVATISLKPEPNSLLEYSLAGGEKDCAIQGPTQAFNSKFIAISQALYQSLSLECVFTNGKYNYTIEYVRPENQPFRVAVQTDHPFAIPGFKHNPSAAKYQYPNPLGLVELYASPDCDLDLRPLQNFKLEFRNCVTALCALTTAMGKHMCSLITDSMK